MASILDRGQLFWFTRVCLSVTEEAVNEVKRQAVAELHRAVTAAEVKATVAVTAERARLEKVVNEVRAQARQEAFALLNSQEDSTEVCNS